MCNSLKAPKFNITKELEKCHNNETDSLRVFCMSFVTGKKLAFR